MGITFLIIFCVLFVIYVKSNQRIIVHDLGAKAEILYDKEHSLRLRGNIIKHKGTKKGNVAIFHGSTFIGRKLPICRMLSRTLSQRGYDVALFDFRGYGESDRPEGIMFEAYDLRKDVDVILSHLGWEECALIGYSLGASIAMNYCTSHKDSRVKAVVALSPGRQFYQRILANNAPEYNGYKTRYMKFTGLKNELPECLFRQIFANANIDNAFDYFKAKQHSALLLVDGEKERDNFKQYMREYYESISPPKAYQTIPGAHHFFNMSSLFSKFIKDKRQQVDIIYYDKKIYNEYTRVILNWLERYVKL